MSKLVLTDDHEYLLDGVRIPGVTEIMQDLGIIDYSFMPERERHYYLTRGEYVHRATHFLDDGDLDRDTVPEDVEPYLIGYERFKMECQFKPLLAEWSSWHSVFRYAGTLDRIGTGKLPRRSRKERILLDLKSGKVPPWVGMQLAAYRALKARMKLSCYALELHGDGTYALKGPYDADKLMRRWLAVLDVYNFKRGN